MLPAVHVAMRTSDRKKVLVRPSDFYYLMALLAEHLHERGIAIYRYCLMQNHIHLLLPLIGFESAIRRELGLVKQTFSRGRRLRVGGTGRHNWASGLMWKEVHDDAYYASVVAYIENNPVEAGLAKEPVLYRWSSARAYTLGLPDPIVTLDHWQEAAALSRAEDLTHLLQVRRVLAMNAMDYRPSV